MKIIILSIVLVFAAAVFSNIDAQVTPPGASDSDLRNNDVRLRSNELERIKREAAKTDPAPVINPEIGTKFPQIKEDFEGLQISEAAVIKSYSTGQSIDYKLMESSAIEVNKSAKRLNSNLFSEKIEKKDEKPQDSEMKKSVRDLIVELDNSIGSFVTSPLFQNLRTVDPEVALRAQIDLVNIIKTSNLLSGEAKKLQ